MVKTKIAYPDEELKEMAGRELTENELDALLVELGENPEDEGCHGFKIFALLEHSKEEIKEALKKLKIIRTK